MAALFRIVAAGEIDARTAESVFVVVAVAGRGTPAPVTLPGRWTSARDVLSCEAVASAPLVRARLVDSAFLLLAVPNEARTRDSAAPDREPGSAGPLLCSPPLSADTGLVELD
ncbi:MAG TPA: hypothetical protein VFW21_03250 [Mycobacterium sp.]|nr:hypothetical protein [Mycobacterium sp.]